jgi:hypothetical protein
VNTNIVDEARKAWLEQFLIELVLHRGETPKKIESPDTDFVFSNNWESLTKYSPVLPFRREKVHKRFYLWQRLKMKVDKTMINN